MHSTECRLGFFLSGSECGGLSVAIYVVITVTVRPVIVRHRHNTPFRYQSLSVNLMFHRIIHAANITRNINARKIGVNLSK